jgi:hypothetical protein
VFVGATKRSLKPVAEAARSDFESAIPLPAGTAGRYLTVQALDANGRVLGTATPAVQANL